MHINIQKYDKVSNKTWKCRQYSWIYKQEIINNNKYHDDEDAEHCSAGKNNLLYSLLPPLSSLFNWPHFLLLLEISQCISPKQTLCTSCLLLKYRIYKNSGQIIMFASHSTEHASNQTLMIKFILFVKIVKRIICWLHISVKT